MQFSVLQITVQCSVQSIVYSPVYSILYRVFLYISPTPRCIPGWSPMAAFYRPRQTYLGHKQHCTLHSPHLPHSPHYTLATLHSPHFPHCMTSLPTPHCTGAIRHLIEHSEKEQIWLYIQRKSKIGCKFREGAKLSVHLEKESNHLSIRR